MRARLPLLRVRVRYASLYKSQVSRVTPSLRDYQADIVERVRSAFSRSRRVLLVSPVGSGKTVMFAYIARSMYERQRRVVILAHRQELIEQICRQLDYWQVPHGLCVRGMRSDAHVLVASTLTLVRRVHSIAEPQLIVIDEAHHATDRNSLGTILAHWRDSRVLGVTATPIRLSGEGMSRSFDELVLGPDTSQLIRTGYLCAYRLFAPPTADTSRLPVRAGDYVAKDAARLMMQRAIVGDVVAHYERHARGMRALAFCVSVAHAHHTASAFAAQGYRAEALDGSMGDAERARKVAAFRAGELQILASCDLVSEGFDVPAIECGIFLRPTKSLALWLQQTGRCLRPHEGKRHAILLDHVGNTMMHGLPDDARNWRKTGWLDAERKRGAQAQSVRLCHICYAANRQGAPRCGECGAIFEIDREARTVAHVKGELIEWQRAKERLDARRAQAMARDYMSLVTLGRRRGYRYPERWAYHVISARMRAKRR